ncbi:MAG TPA: hypothetical protein VK116_01715, partial [Planctomycetota bacterium]|nr:hypothetical protein [Planctomycetota bacterium]
MPRRLTFFEQVRGRGESLFLDGGDFLLGTPGTRPPTRADELRAEREARAIIAAYDLCGYHAVGLGPADIQLGVDKLRELVSKARFRTVCTNLVEKESGKPVFEATTVIELGGVRFGIYSVMLDSLNPTYAERVFGSKYALTDPIAATRKAVADLRGRADVVIGLSQLNTDTNERVAAETVGLDYLIDPYAQFGTKPVWITAVPYVIEKEGRATLARIDGQGSRVGVLSLAFEKDRRRKGHAFREYPLEPHIFPHPDMVMLLDRAKRGGAE